MNLHLPASAEYRNVLAYRAVSVDCGNLAVKSKSDLGELHYPNTIREEKPYENELSFGQLIQKRTQSISINGEKVVVGDTDKDSRYSLDINTSRYDTPDFKKMFLIAVFKHIRFLNEKVIVVTGIPGKQYQNLETREEAFRSIKELAGDYEINGIPFTIVDVIVELQPLATLKYLAFDENGTPRSDAHELVNSKTLVVDLGMGSSDVTILEDGKLEKVFELKDSMYNIYDRMINEMQFMKTKNREASILASEHLTPQRLEQRVRESMLQYKDEMKAFYTASNKETFDITSIVHEHFLSGANGFVQDLRANKIDFESFANVVLTGGGTHTLMHYLKAGLAAYRDNPRVRFRMPDNVIMANAKGYFIAAKHAVNAATNIG